MTGRVSIITPVHNGARTIGETIASLQAQTYDNWEQLVIDDGSTDATQAVVAAFHDARIRLDAQGQAGVSVARNRALDAATGEYLLFLDADDWLLPTALEDHLAFLDQHAAYGVSVGDGFFCTDTRQALVRFSERRMPVAAGDVLARIVVDAGMVGAPAAAMVRRSVIEGHHIRFEPTLRFGEDWLFFIEVARYALFGFIPATTCHYRWHPNNTTQSTQAEDRRRQLWLGRQRVMNSAYFGALPAATRRAFLYDVLLNLLRQQPMTQEMVILSAPFQALPQDMQADLLRLVAAESILEGRNLAQARRWLATAKDRDPSDIQARLLSSLAALHPRLARLALRARRGQSASGELALVDLALPQ